MSCFHRSSIATVFTSVSKNFFQSALSRRFADYHRRRAEAALSVLDSQLAHRSYLCAAEPTIADLFCYGDVAFAEICAFDLHRLPNVVRWTERVTALAGFKAPFALLTMQNAEVL
jgi:glutathione S-transferase